MTEAIIRVFNGDEIVLAQAAERFKRVWQTGRPEPHVFTFSSPAQLFSIISPKRWELIERLQQSGPVSIRGLARLLDRDVKRVHDDVTLLIDWGMIERGEDGKVHVPFSVIHAEFDLRAVA